MGEGPGVRKQALRVRVPRKLQSQQIDAAQICAAELAVTLPAFPMLADSHCPDVVVHHGGGSCFPSSREQLYRASPALLGPRASTQLLVGLAQKPIPTPLLLEVPQDWLPPRLSWKLPWVMSPSLDLLSICS